MGTKMESHEMGKQHGSECELNGIRMENSCTVVGAVIECIL